MQAALTDGTTDKLTRILSL